LDPRRDLARSVRPGPAWPGPGPRAPGALPLPIRVPPPFSSFLPFNSPAHQLPFLHLSPSSPRGALGFGDDDRQIWIPEVSSPPLLSLSLSLFLPFSPLRAPSSLPCARPLAPQRVTPPFPSRALPSVRLLGAAARPLPSPLARRRPSSPARPRPTSQARRVAPSRPPDPGGAAPWPRWRGSPSPSRAAPRARPSPAPLRVAPSAPCVAGSPTPPYARPLGPCARPLSSAWPLAPGSAAPCGLPSSFLRTAIKFKFN
jgi:hypothetical protein